MAHTITLQVYRGDQLLSTQTFDRDVIKIGRLPSAQLKLDDMKVARIHAVIEIPSGSKEYFLQDMGSTDGTLLNNEKVKRTKLKDGDVIVLGDTKLVVVLGGAAAAAAAPKPAGAPAAAAPAAAPVAARPGAAPAPAPAPAAARPATAAPQAAARPATTTTAAPAAARPAATAAPVAATVSVAAPAAAPVFDPSASGYAAGQPMDRIGHDHLDRDAFEEEDAGPIEPESAMTPDNRALELRLYWGDILLNIEHLVKPKQIIIGETRKTDIFISSEGLPKEEFPIIRYIDNEYVLTFFQALDGEVQIGGELKTLKDLCGSSRSTKDEEIQNSYRLNMAMDTKSIVHWGGLTLAMRFVPPPQRMRNVGTNLDFQFLNILIIVLFLMAGSIFSLSLYPYEAEALNEDLMKSDNNFAQFILEPPKPVEQQKAAEEFLKKMEKQSQPAGDVKAPKEKPKEAPKAPAPDNKEVVKNSGIFKALGGSMSQVLGGNSGLGQEVISALGGVTGKAVGDTQGLGGLGLRGAGPGGGGIGNTIGLGGGGIGTQGRGTGYGAGGGQLGAKRETDLSLADMPPVIQGSLDPSLIKKVIQENKNAIRYCYERELQVKKDLSGVIKTQFIIGPTGSVTTSIVKESTMKNPNVENCIAQKIRGLTFPKPKGGGIVVVNYPFVFKSAGG